MTVLLEIPVDDAQGLAIAIAHGADQIELCSALGIGGLTPSFGLMRLAAQAPVPVCAMIRPRAGNFRASPDELEQMCADIDAARQTGLHGVVFGVLNRENALDLPAMARLCDAAAGMAVTLHRAFDLTANWQRALDQAVDLGIGTILTSGQAVTAPQGLPRLAEIFAHAAGRITIMPGAGIGPENLTLFQHLPLRFIHASCGTNLADDTGLYPMGFAQPGHKRPDSARIQALKAGLGALTGPKLG